jgi:hypothetical protein
MSTPARVDGIAVPVPGNTVTARFTIPEGPKKAGSLKLVRARPKCEPLVKDHSGLGAVRVLLNPLQTQFWAHTAGAVTINRRNKTSD